MTTPPTLFDRPALTAHRTRVRREALFLHDAARDEVQDRLAMVNRAFTRVAIVTPFAEIWRDSFPAARIVGDDEALDLQGQAHDLIVHAMALHWANDPVGQIIQCRRALVNDGLFLAVLPGGDTLAELRVALTQAESQVTGGLSPRIAPMGEIRDLGALLQRAGLALPVADSARVTAEYLDLPHLMQDLRAMGETNALAARPRHAARRAVFDTANRLYMEGFANADGRIPATFELICLTGWAPDESQPKPLRPGSAATRLAEALRVPETRLPD